MEAKKILVENQIEIRKIVEEDAIYLAKWLSDPEVLQFYEGRDHPLDIEQVKKVFFSKDDDLTPCLILYDEKPIGYVQYYPIDDAERKVYGYKTNMKIFGMDQFIGEPPYWNKGIGEKFINLVVQFLFTEVQADIIVMDPQIRNTRALRCYEKCGFKTIKILPKHELHEGKMEDCYLIERRR